MKTPTFPLLLLALAVPTWGQLVPAVAKAETHKPLNLSLPRDVTQTTFKSFDESATNDQVESNLRSAPVNGGRDTERLPYGSGYEARQRSSASSATPSGRGRSNGGGGGRASMRRGR